ncbi:MAG: alpha-L-rhamnosidase C-terminal domain-containing protein [Prolixibacteraceae bacterium]
MMRKIIALTVFCGLIISTATSQPFVRQPDQLTDKSFAEWIAPAENFGVFCFRKEISLNEKPENFIVHISADPRYKFFVNGEKVVWGPAVGDPENWKYETVDLAPFLQKGKNVLAAQVWNRGSLNPPNIISTQTAFILQGDSPAEQVANTDKSWRVIKDEGYYTLEMTREIVGGGYIAGGTDSVITSVQPKNWKHLDFDAGSWPFARELGKGNHLGLDTWKGTQWKLKPRDIPFMEQDKQPVAEILEVKGLPFRERKNGKVQFEIPPHSTAEILLDNRVLTMGFPQLHISGGEAASIKMQYQEALFEEDGQKGNRNNWQGKTMKGYYDVLIADGSERIFEPLWIRVFRYVKLTIQTKEEALKINDFYNIFTAYPLEQKAIFEIQDSALQNIWDASWRTARLCAFETYLDCPYYEQLQYIGDTRIQALISMYVAGDDRLARNAIEQLYGSLQPMGLTKSAHPTNGIQIIPPFSLVFIGMIHDYYMMRDDPEFVKQYLPGIKFILEWFINRIDENGMLGALPYWNHIDGGTDFTNGSPPGISEGGSAHMSLLLAYALDYAAELSSGFGDSCDSERFLDISKSLKNNTFERCYTKERGLIAETPDKKIFSQHTNIFGILTDAIPRDKQAETAETILNDSSLIQTTLYFKYYLFQALKKVEMGGKMIPLMDQWKTFLDYGFTTFPEHGIESRSDCHAWSAHPLIGFLTIICGIESDSPGFQSVKITPQPGKLKKIKGSVPHPLGEIAVQYNKQESGNWECRIFLPEKLSGAFHFRGLTKKLSSGENLFMVD